MRVKKRDLDWLAGFLEGEGCFCWRRQLKMSAKGLLMIQVTSTDKDVIERAAGIWDSYCCNNRPRIGKHLPQYNTGIYGKKAHQWMIILLPLMGERRKARIQQLLDFDKSGGGERCLAPPR